MGGEQIFPVLFAGGAPEEIAGLMQVNVRIPSDTVPSNAVPVVVSLSGATSQPGVTIAVAH